MRAGLLPRARPDHLVRMLGAMRAYGQIGAIPRIGALRHGSAIALDDELGELDYAALDTRSNSLARALGRLGVGEGDGVAILCRNHRFILDAAFASSKHGARAIFLNTDSAGPQLAEILEREGATTLVYDDEFAERTADARRELQGVRAWTDRSEGPSGEPTVEELIASADGSKLPAPSAPGRVVILTSGTSGTPKGANRGQPKTLTVPAALLSRIPIRSGGVTFVAPPLFHSWGLLTASLTLGLGTRLVLRRRFDAADVLDTVERSRCTTLIVVPVMLRRLLALGEEEVRGRDLAALRVVAVGGSPLSAELSGRSMEVFGDVLYNVYGSTEVAQAAIADPADLRAAPGCVGRPPLGTSVRVLDEAGREVPPGRTGRIFVSNAVQFEGYTGGGGKEVIDGMMSTGDVGHFDEGGRLLVDGRDDEMVISGAEKVFPAEVEDVLGRHPAVEEAAVTGVPDEEFGQRLRAFVVARPGAGLTEDAVRDHVRENLARYKVPRDVVFMERLPRNATGKVLKRELTLDRAPH
jgi:fatty-acyl-CoA synthase